MTAKIDIQPGGELHRAACTLFRRHQPSPDDSGRCATCGLPTPCPAHRHAAQVIQAAGEHPAWYLGEPPPDGPVATDVASAPWRPVQQPAATHPTVETLGLTGWSVGGYGQRARVPYFEYER
jgi:hypothetical protein